jgi:hypothetical protein
MTNLSLKFDSIEQPVDIMFDPTTNTEHFWNFIKSFAKPSDRIFYQLSHQETLDKFLHNANQAKQLFGFIWDLTKLNQENFNHWHRDIETFDLSQHTPWSQEKRDFFVDLHGSLHAVESCNLSQTSSRNNIQIKWFANSVPWPEPPVFVSDHELQPGDIITDYPHVGKSPWTSFQNNDIENLSQSCRLPDACPPGFVIVLNCRASEQTTRIRKQKLTEWYLKHIDQLGPMFSMDQMFSYFGEYRVGKLRNTDQIKLLKTQTLTSVVVDTL